MLFPGKHEAPTGYHDSDGRFQSVVGWHELRIGRHLGSDDAPGDQYQNLDADGFVIAILWTDAQRLGLESSGRVRVQVVNRQKGGGILVFPGRGSALPYILLGRNEIKDMQAEHKRQKAIDHWADAREREKCCDG